MPAPPDAMTGIDTALETAAVSSQSNPARVPSRSIDVRRISPAPARLGFDRPLDGVAIGGDLAAPREDVESLAVLLGVDRDDHRLAAVALGERRDERRVGERGGVDADLVGAGVDRRRRVRLGADAAADRERDEQARRHFANRRLERSSSFDGGGDVEDHQLVDALGVVAFRQLRRIAGAAQSFEVDALDDRAVANVEAGDDAFGQHRWFRVQGSQRSRFEVRQIRGSSRFAAR